MLFTAGTKNFCRHCYTLYHSDTYASALNVDQLEKYTAFITVIFFRGHLKDPGVDGCIILSWIFRKLFGGYMDWINQAEDRDRWRASVSAVMNLRVL